MAAVNNVLSEACESTSSLLEFVKNDGAVVAEKKSSSGDVAAKPRGKNSKSKRQQSRDSSGSDERDKSREEKESDVDPDFVSEGEESHPGEDGDCDDDDEDDEENEKKDAISPPPNADGRGSRSTTSSPVEDPLDTGGGVGETANFDHDDDNESSLFSPEMDDDEKTGDKSDGGEAKPKKLFRKRKLSDDLAQLVEEHPDLLGLRRSGRNRREVTRLTFRKDSDDESSAKKSKLSKNTIKANANARLSESSDEDSSDAPNRHRQTALPKRKNGRGRQPKSKKVKGRLAPKTNKRKRNLSSDDSNSGASEDSGKYRRGGRRQAAVKAIDYREQSDKTDSEDLVSGAGEEEEDDDREGIEKVLKHRNGRKGAIGGPTTTYNVAERGDPNADFDPDKEEGEVQFLIKWANWAYLHNTWESRASLQAADIKGMRKFDNYLKRMSEIEAWKRTADKETIEYFNCEEEMNDEVYEQYHRVERIIAHLESPEKEGAVDYLVKWEGLPYSECTWEQDTLLVSWYGDKIEEYHARLKSKRVPSKATLDRLDRNRPKFAKLKSQPEYIGGADDSLVLRDYQLDGVNWLIHSWCKSNGVILADEMGLGKTIQAVSFLSVLSHQYNLYGPFLLVVPLSTMTAWQREFQRWSPEFNVVIYLGDVSSRDTIRRQEIYTDVTMRKIKINCLLTTYEILLKDKSFLCSIQWAALLVDEAHRLKNDDSLFYKSLFEFNTSHRLLITGTPLQNSLKELWALLHFIMPQKFDTWEDFEYQHKNSEKKGYASLHKELEPFLLRRVKKEVEKSLPAKVEQLLRVDMTATQKQYYKWILTKNYKALTQGIKGKTSSFVNIIMELKKCCNHAFLIREPTDDKSTAEEKLQQVLRGSGKMVLLDQLLKRLYATGHRVLIFSQLVIMLDIIEEYLQRKQFKFQRLDGSIRGDLRKTAMDHFNAEGSEDFCFLLSTRAGGLGINLATADTVIIFDSDWNPQNDLQAQSRAHRIGQTKQVNIYRLVTKNSVEEDIVERAKRKLVLDHLVIQRMDTTGRTVLSKNAVSSSSSVPFNKEELTAILKFGAQDLFKEAEGEEEDPEVDIDDILQRAETRDQEEVEAETSLQSDLLSAFKVANFNIDNIEDSRTTANGAAGEDTDWEAIIPENERRKVDEEEKAAFEESLHLPPRQRNAIQQMARNTGSDDEDWKSENSGDESSDEESGKRKGGVAGGGKGGRRAQLFGFKDGEIRRFIKSYKKFAHPSSRWEAIATDAELQEHSQTQLLELGDAVAKACREALEGMGANDENAPEGRRKVVTAKLGSVEFQVMPILRYHDDLDPLYSIVPLKGGKPDWSKFTIPESVKAAKLWDVEWEYEDDINLLRGIYLYGLGSWEAIKMDPELKLTEKMLHADKKLKPQTKHLQTRAEYLLKFLAKFYGLPDKKPTSSLALKAAAAASVSKKHDDSAPTGKHKKRRKADADVTEQTIETGPRRKGRPKKDAEEAAQPAIRSVSKKHDSGGKHRGSKHGPASKASKKVKSKEIIDDANDADDDEEYEKQDRNDSKKKGKGPEGVRQVKTKKEKIEHAGPTNRAGERDEDAGDSADDESELELPPDVFKECKSIMRPYRDALKKLNAAGEDDEDHKTCIMTIGDHIKSCLAAKESEGRDTVDVWRRNLWTFISLFTESSWEELLDFYDSSGSSNILHEKPNVKVKKESGVDAIIGTEPSNVVKPEPVTGQHSGNSEDDSKDAGDAGKLGHQRRHRHHRHHHHKHKREEGETETKHSEAAIVNYVGSSAITTSLASSSKAVTKLAKVGSSGGNVKSSKHRVRESSAPRDGTVVDDNSVGESRPSTSPILANRLNQDRPEQSTGAVACSSASSSQDRMPTEDSPIPRLAGDSYRDRRGNYRPYTSKVEDKLESPKKGDGTPSFNNSYNRPPNPEFYKKKFARNRENKSGERPQGEVDEWQEAGGWAAGRWDSDRKGNSGGEFSHSSNFPYNRNGHGHAAKGFVQSISRSDGRLGPRIRPGAYTSSDRSGRLPPPMLFSGSGPPPLSFPPSFPPGAPPSGFHPGPLLPPPFPPPFILESSAASLIAPPIPIFSQVAHNTSSWAFPPNVCPPVDSRPHCDYSEEQSSLVAGLPGDGYPTYTSNCQDARSSSHNSEPTCSSSSFSNETPIYHSDISGSNRSASRYRSNDRPRMSGDPRSISGGTGRSEDLCARDPRRSHDSRGFSETRERDRSSYLRSSSYVGSNNSSRHSSSRSRDADRESGRGYGEARRSSRQGEEDGKGHRRDEINSTGFEGWMHSPEDRSPRKTADGRS